MRPIVHGTLTGYKTRGCRCDACRRACADYEMERRRARGVTPQRGRPSTFGIMDILCGECGQPIEGCHGLLGDWMHTGSRSERCAHGGVASPETPEQFDDRNRRKRYASMGRRGYA